MRRRCPIPFLLLASAGIDGVKVDVQNILETLGAGHGGRVKLASKYHRALEASIARNFPDNGIISCSDKPGQHDFNLLRKLVLPDGSILRAKLPGRPTRDCLFSDPARDGKSLLKIWNLNDHNGVIGVFNCQGAGWCKVGKKNLIHDEQPGTITGIIRAKDVDYLPRVTNDRWNGDAVVYSHFAGDLVYLAKNASLPITLKTREYEVFTVVPVMEMSNKTMFAPIGLVKMFNSGGAIKELKYEVEKPRSVHMKVRGRGIIGAYSSVRPLECNC